MRNLLVAFCCLSVTTGCNKKKFFDGPDFYEDGFESYSSLSDLLLSNDTLWSGTQQTAAGNEIRIDTAVVHSGQQSLKFTAVKSDDNLVSKSSIFKQKMAFWEGETVRLAAWFYIDGTDSLNWLFLFDLEERTPIGAGPGMRLALVNNQLRVEHKFYEPDIVQQEGSEINFPRDAYVEVVWEVKLSKKHDGTVTVWQDGEKIIDSNGEQTLPTDILYSLQGTKGMYTNVETGITANSRDNNLVMYVDDVRFEKVE